MTLTVHDPGSSCTSGGGRLTWRNSSPDRARETGPLVDASRRVSNSTLFLRQRQTAGLRAQGLFACHWPKAGRCSEGRNATVVCCRSDSLEGGGWEPGVPQSSSGVAAVMKRRRLTSKPLSRLVIRPRSSSPPARVDSCSRRRVSSAAALGPRAPDLIPAAHVFDLGREARPHCG